MTGKELQLAIKDAGIPVQEIIQRTGIPRRTFFLLYKKARVEEHYVKAIEQAVGKKLQVLESVNKYQVHPSQDVVKNALDLIKETLELMREKDKVGAAALEELVASNKVFRSILEPAIAKGQLKLDLEFSKK